MEKFNESVVRHDMMKSLNEAVNEEPQYNGRPDGVKEWTFADWFGRDLTGQTYEGSIDCSEEDLTSLKGAPKAVTENFYCDHNQLTSLDGCPEKIGNSFVCDYNLLTSLNDGPKEVGGDFSCKHNMITSLKGCPEKVGKYGGYKFSGFDCQFNELTSLEGGPKKVIGSYWASQNNIISLKGFPDFIDGDFAVDYNHAEITDFTDFNIHNVKYRVLFDHDVVIPNECKIARTDKRIHGTKINQILRKLNDIKDEFIYSGYQDSDEEMEMINDFIAMVEGKRRKKRK